MRFPLAPNAFALVLCAPVWAAAFDAPTAVPPDACATFAESVAAEAAPAGREGGAAAAPAAEPAEAEAVKITLEDAGLTPLLEGAYRDAHEVLGKDDECSDFFGGRDGARRVLDRLVGRLRDEPVPEPSIGIVMQGQYTNITDHRTGVKYRLFDESIVNSKGPFFRQKNGMRTFADCGHFAPNTRGARATMLLHELGHLIQGADGRWVLPNDGDNFALAARNTDRVMKKCGRQIKALDARPAPDGPRPAAGGRG